MITLITPVRDQSGERFECRGRSGRGCCGCSAKNGAEDRSETGRSTKGHERSGEEGGQEGGGDRLHYAVSEQVVGENCEDRDLMEIDMVLREILGMIDGKWNGRVEY